MGDRLRHVLEPSKSRRQITGVATAIEIGDLLFWDSVTSTVLPASSVSYTSLAQAQAAFVENFRGVAEMKSPANSEQQLNPITVATSGIFEYPCASATFEYGDLVGVDDNSGGTALEDQQVIKVTTPDLAIGRVVKDYTSATTTVEIEIFPPAKQDLDNGNEFWIAHTVTNAEDTAGAVSIDTGFGVAPRYIQLTVLAVTTGRTKTDDLDIAFLTSGDAGKITVSDGSANTVTEGDIIHLYARK